MNPELPGGQLLSTLTKCLCNEMVGESGFEPLTSASRTPRATKLRYTPLSMPIMRHATLLSNLFLEF